MEKDLFNIDDVEFKSLEFLKESSEDESSKEEISHNDIVEKINNIITALNKKFYEREDEVEGMIVALLTRQHVLLIGEPGTGKSLLSMEFANIIDKSSYFQWLMTKYTTPEELFGALSIQELEKGVHKRNTTGKLPEAELVFLDEIFKSNSAILNSLLTLINERLFYNNGTPIKSPLISLVGASNEYPEEDEGLEALFDRLLLRYEVEEVKDRGNFVGMLKGDNDNISVPSLSLQELEVAQEIVANVKIGDEIYEVIADIVQELKDEGIRPSARRVKNSIEVIKAKAFLDDRNSVKLSDLLILEHILWNDIEEKETSTDIVKHYAQDVLESALEQIKNEMDEIEFAFENNKNDADVVMESNQKIKYLLTDLKELYQNFPERAGEIEKIEKAITAYQKKIVNSMLEPVSY